MVTNSVYNQFIRKLIYIGDIFDNPDTDRFSPEKGDIRTEIAQQESRVKAIRWFICMKCGLLLNAALKLPTITIGCIPTADRMIVRMTKNDDTPKGEKSPILENNSGMN